MSGAAVVSLPALRKNHHLAVRGIQLALLYRKKKNVYNIDIYKYYCLKNIQHVHCQSLYNEI